MPMSPQPRLCQGRMAARLDEPARAQLRGLRFRCAAVAVRACPCSVSFGCRADLAAHTLCRMGHWLQGAFTCTHCASLTPPCHTLPPLLCREWVASEDGEVLATQLISVLVAEHLSASGEEQPAG